MPKKTKLDWATGTTLELGEAYVMLPPEFLGLSVDERKAKLKELEAEQRIRADMQLRWDLMHKSE